MEQQVHVQTGDPSKNNLALISMILGIFSMVGGIFTFFIPFGGIIGFGCSVAAIILGMKSKVSEKKGFAITGIITGSISGVIYLLAFIFVVLLGAFVGMIFS